MTDLAVIRNTIEGARPVAVELNEDVVAALFAEQHAGRVAYAHVFKRWHTYDAASGRWQPDGTELVLHWVREFVRGLNSGRQEKWAKASTVDAVARLARRDPQLAITGTEFDADPWLLGTPNGPIDLRTGEAVEKSPTLMVSKTTAVAPAASKAPRFMEFLREATGGDTDLIDYLQRLAGYACTGHASEETLQFLHGPGGNGKGVFTGVLLGVLGEYAKQASMDTFIRARGDRHPADLADLAGARLVVAAESAEGARWDEQRIKMLTGRDRISARRMYADFFEYDPQFALMVSSNHPPRLGTVDDAWRRRLHLIPFDQKPAQPDPGLKDALVAEYPQILAWAIDGAEWWSREGLSPPERVRAATDAYLASEDVIGLWHDENCERAPGHEEDRSDLYHSYERWCSEMGHAASSMHKLSRWLRAHAYEQNTKRAGRPFVGLRLIGTSK